MTNSEKDIVRREMTALLRKFLMERGEDVDYMASNIINLPAVFETKDGTKEEFEFEIRVSIPETTEDNDCYAKRESYRIDCEKRAAREEKKRKEKEAKIKKAQKSKK